MKVQKIGMRTIKTGLAVTLAILLGQYLVQDVFYSAIACIISVQDTVKGSMKAGLNRVKGTIVGGIIGFLLALINPGDPILGGLGIILVIYTCNTLKISSIVVSGVTFLSIHLCVSSYDPAYYSFHRVVDTSFGVLVAVIVNYLVARPDYFNKTIEEFKRVEKSAINLINQRIQSKEKFEINIFKSDIQKLEKIYNKLRDELEYSKNKDIDIETLENTIDVCREIYFHMQSIELLEKESYLNAKTYKELKKLHHIEEICIDVEENESPVFNYHLSKIIECVKSLEEFNHCVCCEN